MSFITSLFGLNTKTKENITLLSPSEFKEQIQQKDIQIIDVRTSLEFKSGHIEGAKNIDFYSGKFTIEFSKLDKNKPIYLYCRSGNRSRQTANKLASMGFTEIYDLRGGITNYKL